jgi:hypothetical protein
MEPLQAGIAAAREGRRAEARALLKEALQANPMSEQGWLWMSAVVDTDAERRVCLERVLSINPLNQTARFELKKLEPASGSDAGGDLGLPVPPPAQTRPAGPEVKTGQLQTPGSLHSQPTLGMESLSPQRRPIQRLSPESDTWDSLAHLRAAQFEPAVPSSEGTSRGPDRFMAVVLIGGLSLTAIVGALMLAVLLLVGWPP